MSKLKIKAGDQVVVLSGNHKGDQGAVVKIFPKESKAIVGGVNLVKKHVKPNAERPQGGIVEREAAIHISNLALVDPTNGKPTRVGFQIQDGKKVRISKKSREVLKDIVKN